MGNEIEREGSDSDVFRGIAQTLVQALGNKMNNLEKAKRHLNLEPETSLTQIHSLTTEMPYSIKFID